MAEVDRAAKGTWSWLRWILGTLLLLLLVVLGVMLVGRFIVGANSWALLTAYVLTMCAVGAIGLTARGPAGWTFVGAGVLITGLGCIAAPAYRSNHHRSLSAKEGLAQDAVVHLAIERLTQVGSIKTSEAWSPRAPCCDQAANGVCSRGQNAQAWATEVWRDVAFDGPRADFRSQLRIVRDGSNYLVEARADLDCDGDFSLTAIRLEHVEPATWTSRAPVRERDLE